MDETGFVGWLSSVMGGAATTLFGAAMGRLMWHSSEVRKGQRRFVGPELIWEIPVALGMAIIGEAIARYIDAGATVSTGIVALAAYIGPRGAEVLLTKWLNRSAP
ncbi:phage holin family protein [Leisingera daeponensis]|uniref:Phage holin family protein n=1 Tax=Leisingera daeponensis TaxID=405746 RepID=A0ABS7NEJ9_9RHOB|nr:phage holin family protein [Leisingera daeponensis]MBY6138516.1 phage holin family protein [Leisingera daeponensis]